MEMPNTIRKQDQPRSLPAILVSQIPLWLFTLTVSIEGFPAPRLPVWVAIGVSFLGITVILYLAWKKQINASWLLMMMPFVIMMRLDEIATSYKTPFLICCVAIVSASVFAYHYFLGYRWRWLILIAGVVLTILAADHAAKAYWPLLDQGFLECYPSCAPVSGENTPWWVLFFTP